MCYQVLAGVCLPHCSVPNSAADMMVITQKRVGAFLDGWLTVHRSITLVDFQLDAQNSYLFIYNTFIKILYMFRALPCVSSGGRRRNCIYAASGIVSLCR